MSRPFRPGRGVNVFEPGVAATRKMRVVPGGGRAGARPSRRERRRRVNGVRKIKVDSVLHRNDIMIYLREKSGEGIEHHLEQKDEIVTNTYHARHL